MAECWATSYLGYPDFFATSGKGRHVADNFLTFASAARSGTPYSAAKRAGFRGVTSHQVETKKSAFQEYGLLYVEPRSDTISLTPVGNFIYDTVAGPNRGVTSRWMVHYALARALSRYQFRNPMGTAGTTRRASVRSSDVRPYLALYFLLDTLDGFLTQSELFGAIFGLSRMSDLRALAQDIRNHRSTGKRFAPLPSLPKDTRTADNLRIYFISHLGLEGAIIDRGTTDVYGASEPTYEIGDDDSREVVASVLYDQWPDWLDPTKAAPAAESFTTIPAYFNFGIGQWDASLATDSVRAGVRMSMTIPMQDDVDVLRGLGGKAFAEGMKRLVLHESIERKVRSGTLIRRAKRLYRAAHNGKLPCEVCGVDLSVRYGPRGDGYIEAHHKVPISTLTTAVLARPSDLAMICSNCHRMIHRVPWITVAQLKAMTSP